jgi:hypothetical protein
MRPKTWRNGFSEQRNEVTQSVRYWGEGHVVDGTDSMNQFSTLRPALTSK